MKMVFVRDLKPDDVLGKSVYNSDGKLLIRNGTKITRSSINFLRDNMIFLVYLEDEALEDVEVSDKITEIKVNTLEKIPTIFDDFINGKQQEAKKALEFIGSLVDSVIDEGMEKVNLYELKSYDQYTYIHCIDTGIMACFLGQALGYDDERLKELSISAILHDIGKTKIPNNIINKKEPLTEEEFKVLKLHPQYGKAILENFGALSSDIIRGVFEHHERFDGSGYPLGLKGNEISEFGKIIGICDVFTAVSANRAYRKRFKPNEAYELILSGSGTMFDPNIVQRFRMTFFVYPLGACVRLSNGIEGYVVRQNATFPNRPVIRVTYDIKTRQPISPYEINLMDNYNVTIEEVI